MVDPQRSAPTAGEGAQKAAGPTHDDTAQLTLEDALRARDEGMQAATHASDVAWVLACDTAIQRLADRGDEFTSDQVRSMVGPPVAHSPNAFGPRFMAAARAGTIVKVGYRQSLRPERRGGPVAVWRRGVR